MTNKGIKSLWGYPLIDSKGRHAIDDVRSNLENNFQKKTDDTLTTTSKTISGAINEVNTQCKDIKQNPNFNTTSSSALCGVELIDNTGWTTDGWTGNFNDGFTNTVGQTKPLTKTLGNTGTRFYQIEFRVESPTPAGIPNASTDFTVCIGNCEPFVTYQGGGSMDYKFGIQSVSDGDLVFTPGVTFDGTIKNISVREITGTLKNSMEFKDVNNTVSTVIKNSFSGLKNIYIGSNNTATKNTTGEYNVAIGESSMQNNTTGYWNTAIGIESLQNNTVGSRNIAIGRLAMRDNVSGDRNIAIGTFALERNTTGRQNIVLGADSLWVNTTGSRNISIGMGTMGENITGDENIAIGYIALEQNKTGSNNIALGYGSMGNANGNDNVAIGKFAMKNATTNKNVAIGYGAMLNTTTGDNNIALGMNSFLSNTTGRECVAIGANASTNSNGDETTSIGAWAGNSCTNGKNTFIGYSAGRNITTGANNLCIGRNTLLAGTNPTDNNKYNIGNVLYGDMITKTLGIGVISPSAYLHLPTSNGGVGTAPIKFQTNTSLLTVKEPGAFETDGNKLYFTQADGTRKEIAFV